MKDNSNDNCPFVIFGDEWGLHPTSVQHLARGLAENHPLLYVNTFWQRRFRWNLDDARRACHKLRMLASPAPRTSGSTLPLPGAHFYSPRSEEHTSELQSQFHLVCRLLLEKKNK